MNTNLTFLLNIVLLVLVSTSAFGISSKKDLIESVTRPYIKDILNVYPEMDSENPFKDSNSKSSDRIAYINKHKEDIADMIIDFERTFPGASFAFLGRDSALIHDIFETFYRTLGQPERIIRLDASGASIRSGDSKMRAQFLISNGFQPEAIEDGYPYIMVDSTTFNRAGGNQAQSSLLLDSGYEYMEKMGLKTRKLSRKFNFINVKASLYNGKLYRSRHSVDPVKFIEEQEVIMSKSGPTELITIDIEKLTYGDEWHDTFSAFKTKKDASGKDIVYAVPSAEYSKDHHKKILSEQYDLIRIISSKDFIKIVQDRALEVGFSFPIQRPKPVKVSASVTPGFSETDLASRQLARLKFIKDEMKILDRGANWDKIKKDIQRDFKDNPEEFLVRAAELKLSSLFDKDFFSSNFKGERFKPIAESLIDAKLDMTEVINLINLLATDYDKVNFYKTLIKQVKTVDDFNAMLLGIENKAEAKAILMNELPKLLKLDISSKDLSQLEKIMSQQDIVVALISNAKDHFELLSLIKKYNSIVRTNLTDFAIRKFIKLNPYPNQILQFKNILDNQITEYQEALLGLSQVKSSKQFVSYIKKLELNITKNNFNTIIRESINDFFLSLNPKNEEIIEVYKALSDYSSELEHKLLQTFANQLKNGTLNIRMLTDVLSHPIWGGSDKQLRTFSELVLGIQDAAKLLEFIVTELKPDLESIENFSNQLKLEPNHKYTLIEQAINKSILSSNDLAKAIYILNQDNLETRKDISLNAVEQMIQRSASSKEILKSTILYHHNIHDLGLLKLIDYLLANENDPYEMFLYLKKSITNREHVFFNYLDNNQFFLKEKSFQSLNSFLEKISLPNDRKADYILSWIEKTENPAFEDLKMALKSANTLVRPDQYLKALESKKNYLLSLNLKISDIVEILKISNQFSAKVYPDLWSKGFEQVRTFKDFSELTQAVGVQDLSVQTDYLNTFLKLKMDVIKKINFSSTEALTFLKSFNFNSTHGGAKDFVEYTISKVKITSASNFVDLIQIYLRKTSKNSSPLDQEMSFLVANIDKFYRSRPSSNDLNQLINMSELSSSVKSKIARDGLHHIVDSDNAKLVKMKGISPTSLYTNLRLLLDSKKMQKGQSSAGAGDLKCMKYYIEARNL